MTLTYISYILHNDTQYVLSSALSPGCHEQEDGLCDKPDVCPCPCHLLCELDGGHEFPQGPTGKSRLELSQHIA